MLGTESVLVVRRSTFISAGAARIWEEFASFERMERWWGATIGDPEAGTAKGQRLVTYEPRAGGHIEMEVSLDGTPARYGGRITVFEPGRELTFEDDWIPNMGWRAPTFVTIRLTPASGGTVVEILHHGFERTGDDAASEHRGYEGGWSMTQLNALREIVESR